MKRFKLLAAAAALTLAPLAAQADEAMTEALSALETKAWDAWAAGNTDAYGAMLGDPAVLVTEAGTIAGKEAMADVSIPEGCGDRSYELFDQEAHVLADGVAALTFEAAYSQTCEDVPIQTTVMMTSIYAEQGGDWKLVLVSEIPAASYFEGDPEESEALEEGELEEEDLDPDAGYR